MKRRLIKAEYGILAAFAAVLALMLLVHMWIVADYTENLLSLQQNNLLATAKTVGSSLQEYYRVGLENFDLYFDGRVGEKRADQFFREYPEVSAAAVLDENGAVLWRRGADYEALFQDAREDCPAEGAVLLPPILAQPGQFVQIMVKPISWKESPACICAAIETEQVYERIAKPVKIGENGYSMAKQWDGTILMHQSKEQIGLNAVSGRLEYFGSDTIDLSDLKKLVVEQRENGEGSRVLSSYWWEDGKKPVKTRKLVAYNQIKVGSETWIVNCTLAYDEVILPLRQAQGSLLALAIFAVAAFAGALAATLTWRARRKTMELEMKHLSELHAKDEQLRHKDKIQTLGTMASAISHEFRNYLTPILLYTDLLLGGENLDENDKAMISEIQTSAQQAKGLTEELSQYAHSGRGGQEKIPILVTEKLQRALFWVQKTLPENITLTSRLEQSDGFCLLGTQGMIRQIVINLCNNAVHAIGESRGQITVTGTLLPEEKKYRIHVWDDGPCIPAELQKEIFTPFFSTKKAGEGTGLGLPIIANLLREVGGEIEARSEPDYGTAFTVTLPLTPLTEVST